MQRGDAGGRLPILGDDDFRILRGEADIVTGAGVEFPDRDFDCGHAWSVTRVTRFVKSSTDR